MLQVIKVKKIKKNGTTLVLTLFMILVMSLGTQFLIIIANFNIAATSKIVFHKMAIQAAKSGIEWGLVKIVNNNKCFEPVNLKINQQGINNFSVYITCFENSNYYTLNSEAIRGQLNNNKFSNNYFMHTINIDYSKEKLLPTLTQIAPP